MSLADQPYCYHCATYGHEPSECWASPDRAALSHGTRQAEPVALSTLTVTDAMVDAYLKAQREAVEYADRNFGRPNIGGLHTDTVRGACRAGLRAALAASAPALQADECEACWRTVKEGPCPEGWCDIGKGAGGADQG